MKKIPVNGRQKLRRRIFIALTIMLLVLAIAISGCGGGGGGGGGNPPPPPTETATITGDLSVDAQSTPIRGARCGFVDQQGNQSTTVISNGDGAFSLQAPVDTDGYVRCIPPALSNLALSTYCSTQGLSDGDVIDGENVTLATTVAAQIIASENPEKPSDRKAELLAEIDEATDPQLNLVVELSKKLYIAMLQHSLDVTFTSLSSGEGDDGGGAGGYAGNGGDNSPLADAQCDFVVSDSLGDDRKVLYNAALADFYDDGLVNRPDLADIQEEINGQYRGRETAIIRAFDQVFPSGIGQSYTCTTDEDGHFFIAIPSNVSGYVRCVPKDQGDLALAAYIPGRIKGESLLGQDVNPATTVHSHRIASKLRNLATESQRVIKENYLQDIQGLDVMVLYEGDAVSGFQLRPGTAPADKDVGLVAFSATSLYNVLYKNNSNVDYLATLDDFCQKQGLDPDFLTVQGMPSEFAQQLSEVMAAAVAQAESALDVVLKDALATARINVKVSEIKGGQPVPGAVVNIVEDVDCRGCGTRTNDNGLLSLVLSGLSDEPADITLSARDSSGHETTETAQMVALGTVDIEMGLSPSFTLSVDIDNCEGHVYSDNDHINCYLSDYDYSTISGKCTAEIAAGETVTLTADSNQCSFDKWEGTACSGSPAVTCTMTMDQDHTITSVFD